MPTQITRLISRFMTAAGPLFPSYSSPTQSQSPSSKVRISAGIRFHLLSPSDVAILVIRVWHLFSHSRLIQISIIVMFASSVILAMGFTIDSAVRIRLQPTGLVIGHLKILGCRANRPFKFWRIYLPSLFLHVRSQFRSLVGQRTEFDRRSDCVICADCLPRLEK